MTRARDLRRRASSRRRAHAECEAAGRGVREWLTLTVDLQRCRPGDVEALTAFLGAVDLTLSGLDSPSVRLWVERDEAGAIVGSTGYELSGDGRHALIRSVAVAPTQRSRGLGSTLATFALTRAAQEGASTAWLFSRRSGLFWQSLGFEPADRDELAAALADSQQVRLFQRTGQLGREVAWSRELGGRTRACTHETSPAAPPATENRR